jgi:hypothetical protein
MPEIKSPIGNVSMPSGGRLPTFKVEDPTIQEAPPQERLPIEPPVRSSTPQKITAEQYNEYKQRLQESNFTAKSTDNDFDYDAAKKQALNSDDEQFLGFLQGGEPDRGGLQNARQNAKRKEAAISPGNKKKLEILLGLGRKTTSVVIDDSEIILQNLTSTQTKKVLNAVAELRLEPGKIKFDQIYITKHMVIGFALKSIDGQNLSDLLGPDDTDEAREAMVGEMDSDVVNELYNSYIKNIGNALQLNQDVGEEIKK